MKKVVVLAVVLGISFLQFARAADAPLDCSTGPLERSFGGTSWLIYSCTDHQTLVVITASGSPAMPFVFSFYKKEGTYQLYGEGTGRIELTDAAYKELSVLNETEIRALIQQTLSMRGK